MHPSLLLPAAALLVALAGGAAPPLPGPVLESCAAPPSELAPALMSLLPKEGLSVREGDVRLADIWLRSKPELNPRAATGLGIEAGWLASGSFVGVLRFHSDWIDFKARPVKAGVYTLRYAIQPADGNHMGVTEQRDFLLLSPAASDISSAALDVQALGALSCKASGTKHPAVLALLPATHEAGLTADAAGHLLLTTRIGDQRLAFVIRGHAVVEGY